MALGNERELTAEETVKILSLDSNDITSSLITKLFAKSEYDKPPLYRVNDYFKLPKERFKTKKDVYTTIGIYIANLHLIQPRFSKIFGYLNKPFDGKLVSFIEDKLSDALYYDHISTDDMADYYNRIQWLGGHDQMSFLSPSITPALLKPPKVVIDKKNKLLKEHKEELKDTNPKNAVVAANIESELVKDAEEYLKTQDGYENFASKSKINIGNNYKTMNIMRGPLLNSYTGKYKVNRSEYNTGITKDEYASTADASVIGAYARAINTAKGGYLAKKSNQTLNAVMADKKGSDCGTKMTIDVFIYPSMKNDYLNRYIVENGKLVELTVDNIDKYVNTTVHMRTALFCKCKEPYYCNVCLGNQPYLLGLEHFGLAISRIPNKLLTLSMKKFHDLTVKTKKIDMDTIFEFDN